MLSSHLRAVRAAVVFVSVLVLAVPASGAGWKRINPPTQALTNFYNVSIAPTVGPGITIAWGWHASLTASSAEGIASATFTPTLADPAPAPVLGSIAAGWRSIDNDVPLISFDGGLKAIVGGWPGGDGTGFGHYAIPLDAAGNGGAPVLVGVGNDDLGLTGVLAAGRPLWANAGAGVYRDLAPTQTGIEFNPYGCCAYSATVAEDAAGNVWIAWYSNATDHTGLFMRQVDPATGNPIGDPLAVPNFAGIFDNRIPLVCSPLGAGCRVVFTHDEAAVLGDESVMSWAPGEAHATLISKISTPRGLDASYDAQGRLWVGWFDRGDSTKQKPSGYFVTRGDARGAGGVIGNVGQPTKNNGYASDWQLRVQSMGDNLLLLPTWDAGDSNIGVYAGFFGPPTDSLVPVRSPGPRDTDVQSTPNGKGFRIQVQFNVPKICAKPCSARSELRIRSGRRLYAAKPLPGDTPVVLGTRGGIALAQGLGKKIRFFLTVSKAQLLKAPFTTQGGFRVAETRLRVWIKNGTTETLYVRDGRIRVSIARIKSGALPGLAGIL